MCGLAFIVFSPLLSVSIARADVATAVDTVPFSIDGRGYDLVHRVNARGGYAYVGDFSPQGVRVGDIVAVSIFQYGSDKAFGVKWITSSSGYASLLQVDEASRTAYFKCLTASCSVSSLAKLQNDASYVFSAFRINPSASANYSKDFSDVKAYLARLQDWLSILSNRLININDTISDTRQIQRDILKEAKRLADKEDNARRRENNAKNDAENTKSELSRQSDAEKGAGGSLQALGGGFKDLFSASPKAPKVSGSYHGMPLSLDFSSLPDPPGFIIALESIPAFYISIKCLFHLFQMIPELIRAWRDHTMSARMIFDFI